MKRKTNVVIFSSGISEQKGLTDRIKYGLEARGCECCCWRELFASSNHAERIALLPMLIKKIPTFDFAVLICEGHDKAVMVRNGENVEINAMRDNVLFEIGLCSVALGMDKVILLADKEVRLPEDLEGIDGQTALKEFFLPEHSDTAEFDRLTDDIIHYIDKNSRIFSPVVVGASASTASGYVTNFVFRCADSVYNGFIDKQTQQKIIPEKGKIKMEIYIPYVFTADASAAARKKQAELRTGIIPSARRRQLEFNYTVEDGCIIIRDYPTTLVTSYNTARTILNLKADDSADPNAQARFVAKELDLFESALNSLISKSYFENYVRYYYNDETIPSEKELEKMAELVDSGIKVIRTEY